MNQRKDFFKNILIFGVSSFGSRAITILLLPMYSYTLTISEYGNVDILITLTMLFMPFMSLSLNEAILKFCIEDDGDNSSILSSALIIFMIIATVVGFVVCIIDYFLFNYEYTLYFYFILVSMSIYEYFSKFSNGLGKPITYAVSNVIVAFSSLILNVYFVYYLKQGIEGVLIASSVSYTMGIIFLYTKLKLNNYIGISYFNKDLIFKMLGISLPLIPNAAMWWVFNASDRVILFNISGAEEAGVYGVANKVAAFIVIINAVIFQAWQISALKQKSLVNRDVFYSKVINIYMIFMIFFASLLISFNQSILQEILSPDFSQSWKIGNLLIFSSVFYCAASFLGVFYVVFENTKRAFKTSLYTAIINIIFNFILIPYYGVYGAAISTIISTLFIFFVRIYDTTKLVDYTLSKWSIYIYPSLLFLQMLSVSFGEYVFSFIITIILFITLLISVKFNFLKDAKG